MREHLLGVVLLVLLVGCAPTSIVPTPTAAPITLTPEPLRVAYPESVEPLVQGLASAYRRDHPMVQLILLERAERLAWRSLEQGEVDLAIVGALPSDEPPGDLWSATLARDGLAVVVNPQNGLPGLTLTQLRELFQGRVENWEPWGGLPGAPQLVSREEASGEYILFQERVMGDFPVALTARLAPTTEAVLAMVAEDPLAVGYLSAARLDGRVRPLAVEGVPPAPDPLASGFYPLTRDLHLVTTGEPQGALRDLVQWLVSAEGQSVVRTHGWQPAPAE